MIRVSIEANDGAQLRQLLVGMLAGASIAAPAVPAPQPEKHDTASDDTSQMQSTGPLAAAPATQPEPPTPSEQRKRGRPAKAKAEPPAPTGEAPPPADAASGENSGSTADPAPGGETTAQPEQPITGSVMDPKAPDVTDVRAALQSYAAKKGLPACGNLLEKFGANQVSKLKPEDYAAFIAECAA